MFTKLHLLIILITFSLVEFKSQCSVNITASSNSVFCDTSTIQLVASGIGTSSIIFSDDFNSSSADPAWTNTPVGNFTNPCFPPPDLSTAFWVANSPSPRQFITPVMDLTYGGTVCFDLVAGPNSSGATCNKPEVLSVSYYDGSNWVFLQTFNCPSGVCSNWDTWTNFCFTIPPSILHNNLQVKLENILTDNSSFSQKRDNWGIDNFIVTANDPFYYDWSHISGTNFPPGDDSILNVNINSTTNFQVTYTNGGGVSCQDNITINYNAMSINSITPTDESCSNYADGSIDVSILGGSPPYSYDLTGPSNISNNSVNLINSFSSLPAGNYSVSITDQSLCTVSQNNILINSGPICCNLNVSSIVNPPICNGDTGNINASYSNATGSVSFQWFDALTNLPITGQNTENLWGVNAGSYYLQVTDQQCTITEYADIIDPSSISFSSTLNYETCSNSNGSISINPSGGSIPYQYSFDGGVTWLSTNLLNNLSSSGSPYIINVKDGNNCLSTSESVSITNLPEPTIDNVISFGPSCYNDNNGYIEIISSSSSIPIEFSLDNGLSYSNSNVFTNLSSGSYSIKVKDSNNCETSFSSITFNNPAELVLSSIMSPASCFGICDGSIDLSASSGGSGSLQYSVTGLSNLSSNSIYNSQCPGLFDIVIQDDSGCTAYANNTVLDPPEIITSINITHPSCTGSSDGQVDFLPNGGVGGFTFYWNGNLTSSSSINNLAATSFGLNDTLIVVDANGCADTSFVTLTSVSNTPSPIINSINTTDPLCNNDSTGTIEVVVSGGASPLTYDIGNGNLVSNNNLFIDLPAASYNITVTDANNCSSSTTNTNLVNPPSLNIDVLFNDARCSYTNDGTINMSGSNGGTGLIEYSIDGGSNYVLSNGVFQNVLPGNYSLSIKDANGCTTDSSNTILFPMPINIQATPTSPLCIGDTNGFIDFIVSGGSGFYNITWDSPPSFGTPPPWGNGSNLWGNNSNYITSNTISNLPAISDTIWVSDLNDCRDSLEVVILVPNSVKIDSLIVNSLLCHGDTNGSIEALVSNSDSLTIDGVNFQSSNLFPNLSSGSGFLVAIDTNSCYDSAFYNVETPQQILLNQFFQDTVCIGDSIHYNLNPNGGVPPYSYYWDNLFATNPVVLYPQDSASFQYFVTDSNNCSSDTLIVELKLYDQLNVSLSLYEDTICIGDSVVVNAFISGGSGQGYSFNWSNGLSNNAQQTLVPVQPTNYTLVVNDNCSTPNDSVSVNIFVNPLPDPDFDYSINTGCYPLEVLFSEINPDTGYSTTWDFGDGFSSFNLDTVSHIYNTVGQYDVSLSLINVNSNCENTISYQSLIEVTDYPIADFSFNPTSISTLSPYVDFIDLSSNDATIYNWEVNIGNNETLQFSDPNIGPVLYNVDGLDTLQTCLHISTNLTGCVDSICKSITIENKNYLYAPNAFSPNDDGKNDVFSPYVNSNSIISYQMLIYNRWGNKVFESSEINLGWDGFGIDQNICPQGVYVYKIIIEESFETKKTIYKGNITLVR